MPYISLDNLTRYDGKIKEYAEDNFASVETLNWQKTEKAGAAAFYPVPETVLEPVVDFLFTETGPAEGTKAPDNPSTITGVSSASLWLAGKNISFTMPYYNFVDGERTVNGVTFKANADGSVTANGTATANANLALYNSTNVSRYGTPIGVGTWRLSGCPAGGGGSSYALQSVLASGYGSTPYDYGSGSTITVTKPGAKIGITLRISSGYTAQNLVFKPQIELASVATEYEQPVEKQEYAISLGSTYYGGTVDVATGVMTVTQTSLLFNGSTNFSDSGFSEGTDTYTLRLYPSPARSTALPRAAAIACDRLPATPGSIGSSTTPGFYFSANSASVNLLVSKTDIGISSGATKAAVQTAVNAWFATYPAILVYPVATPTIVQLTPQQILSLSQPDPYAPRINTVYSDQQSVQMGYPKSPQAFQNELTSAIVSLGGNV